ncbi:MAG TPA: NnrU family protein [Pseudomonadales bacterium]|nr:NnrU family protein [Pseudomonadales bacterium]
MEFLLVASILFLVTHLGISSTPLRGMLMNGLGESSYLAIYSFLAAVTIGVLIYAYSHISHGMFLWMPGIPEHAFAKALMPFAFILLVGGLMAKNPTAVRADAAINEPLDGMLKIVRHPVQWAILIWAVGHIVANGDKASIVFFGSFAILSSVGMIAMDAKRRHRPEPEWQSFYASTSYWPFAALISGRTSLKSGDINWLAVGIAIVLFVVVYIFHKWIAGVALY